MARKRDRPRKPHLLSHTRPPTLSKPPSLSSSATRTLIRQHHTLQKQLTAALATNNALLAASLRAQIDATGGLQRYQRASIQGQSSERGGDSSKVLMQWLAPTLASVSSPSSRDAKKRRLLEVGALKVDNACSRSGAFHVDRLDLHSQHANILEEDFMIRPFPQNDGLQTHGYDVVSLSLVVNYVPDAAGRGEMLKRVRGFLRHVSRSDTFEEVDTKAKEAERENKFPGLFLVLPASCVVNSRYMDEPRLKSMMGSLGFELSERKLSSKLVYYYWRCLEGELDGKQYDKKEVRKGGGRNNFAIVLQ